MRVMTNYSGTDPYKTCETCVVKDWCGRRCGKVALPNDYALNPECSGYIMLEQAIKLSGIPKEYRYANLSTYNISPENEIQRGIVEVLLDNPVKLVKTGTNVALFNYNTGTGKTFTACAIANEFIIKACTNPDWFDFENPMALYVNYGDWANEIRAAHQRHKPELYDEMYMNIDRMKEVPLLILDDIGSGRITDVIRDLTYDIINKRKEEQKATIYTSNLVDEMMRQDDALGQRIMSRVMFNTTAINLVGRDRRKNCVTSEK